MNHREKSTNGRHHRVPKRHYPVLCCVFKNLRSLVRSPEISKTRSLLGKDSLYICFIDKTKLTVTFHWFTLHRIENNTTENVFASIDFPLLPSPCRYSSSVVAVGPEIFFIPGFSIPSSSFCIFDTQSGKVCQGPCMLVKRRYNCVGLVGGKIYVIGGYREDKIPEERFDLKTQTWEAAPIPDEIDSSIWIYGANVSFDRKVCALSFLNGMTCYDTRFTSSTLDLFINVTVSVSCSLSLSPYRFYDELHCCCLLALFLLPLSIKPI